MEDVDMKNPIKIATIGGGSSYTPELVEGFIKRYHELPLRELWLVDIEEGKGKFNRRFSRWLFLRPFLGAVVAPVFIWGIPFFIDNPEPIGEKLGFTAFMGGLLAKSVLDLIKGLFKNVFKT